VVKLREVMGDSAPTGGAPQKKGHQKRMNKLQREGEREGKHGRFARFERPSPHGEGNRPEGHWGGPSMGMDL